MKLMRTVFCLLMIGAACCSCVREDFEDCFPTHKLILSYIGDGEDEIFNTKVNHVQMYIFNEENRCVSSSELTESQVQDRMVELPRLTPGNYRVICIGNPHETDVLELHSCDFEEMLFSHEDHLDGVIASTDDSLYYATADCRIMPYIPEGNNEYTYLVPFASSHYDLSVEVIGVPEEITRTGNYMPHIKIHGVSTETDFENHVTEATSDYTMEHALDAEKMNMYAFANIMRHGLVDGKQNHEDINVCFYLSEDAAPFVTVNLAEFLEDHPTIDCSKHEVHIPIRIEFKSMDVTVTVPDWFVENVTPEFEKN